MKKIIMITVMALAFFACSDSSNDEKTVTDASSSSTEVCVPVDAVICEEGDADCTAVEAVVCDEELPRDGRGRN